MQSYSGSQKKEVDSTQTTYGDQDPQNIDSLQNPHSDSIGNGRDESRHNPDFTPQQDDDGVSNPESKKPSVQEINEEIDLKKNRNTLISGVLAGCAVLPIVVLGLMAFGVINVSSLVLFSGYGASEVVLGLIGVSALSQVSLAFTSISGVSKIEEKKPRIFDGVNPSIAEDQYNKKLEEQQREQNDIKKNNSKKDSKSPESWRSRLSSQRNDGISSSL